MESRFSVSRTSSCIDPRHVECMAKQSAEKPEIFLCRHEIRIELKMNGRNHFRKLLDRFDDKERQVPDCVYAAIQEEIKECPSMDYAAAVRVALQKRQWREYYDCIPWIVHKLTSAQPPSRNSILMQTFINRDSAFECPVCLETVACPSFPHGSMFVPGTEPDSTQVDVAPRPQETVPCISQHETAPPIGWLCRLGCNHVFCQPCTRKLSVTGTIKCPLCRRQQVVQIPERKPHTSLLTQDQKNQLLQDFQRIGTVWHTVRGARTSFLNHHYVLMRLAQGRGIHLPDAGHGVRSSAKLAALDHVWYKICRELN